MSRRSIRTYACASPFPVLQSSDSPSPASSFVRGRSSYTCTQKKRELASLSSSSLSSSSLPPSSFHLPSFLSPPPPPSFLHTHLLFIFLCSALQIFLLFFCHCIHVAKQQKDVGGNWPALAGWSAGCDPTWTWSWVGVYMAANPERGPVGAGECFSALVKWRDASVANFTDSTEYRYCHDIL